MFNDQNNELNIEKKIKSKNTDLKKNKNKKSGRSWHTL